MDGIVGEGTHKELLRALSGEKPLVSVQSKNEKFPISNDVKKVDMGQKFGSVMMQQS